MILQTITFSIIFLVWLICIFYYFYKTGENFFKAIAANKEREYRGYNQELHKINPLRLIGIFPIPYITELQFNSNAKSFLEKRKSYVIKFYISWIGLFVFFYLFRDYLN